MIWSFVSYFFSTLLNQAVTSACLSPSLFVVQNLETCTVFTQHSHFCPSASHPPKHGSTDVLDVANPSVHVGPKQVCSVTVAFVLLFR